MRNLLLGQILGQVFSRAAGGRGRGGLGRGLGGAAVGGILGSVLGGRRGAARGGLGGNPALVLAMLLPLAMRWVQRNGGIEAVLGRLRQKGYDRQAASWVSTGDNQDIDVKAIDEVVGREELSRLSQQLGVPEQEVAQGFAEILPEMVDQLTPQGQVEPQADQVLDEGRALLEAELEPERETRS